MKSLKAFKHIFKVLCAFWFINDFLQGFQSLKKLVSSHSQMSSTAFEEPET